ncbi:MAG: hypothetical protein KBT34_11295 [Prevotella sp.]|nr:hypothetical protein [Candidatus Prevotella equi]
MKKIIFSAIAFAAVGLASCGGNKTEQSSELEDSVVEFVQSELKKEMIQELDSLTDEMSKCGAPAFLKKNASGIQLTDEEKKAKPEYLLNPANAASATLLSEKYRALTAMRIDREVAVLYGMPVADFDEQITKLLADINDPALEENYKNGPDSTSLAVFYTAEKENGRLNLFWQCMASSNIESLYILSKNVDKFTATMDDNAATKLTNRLAHIAVSANALVDFDSEFKVVAESINLLKDVNAKTVKELREQLKEQKENIEKSRNILVKYFFNKPDLKS